MVRSRITATHLRHASILAATLLLALGHVQVSHAILAPGADPALFGEFYNHDHGAEPDADHDADHATAGAVAAPFQASVRWTNTATDGFNATQGNPTNLTWSIVPDGTAISAAFNGDSNAPSSLISFMDGLHGSATGSLQNRPWFPIFDNAFKRISDLSGVEYIYEPNDDGNSVGGIGGFSPAGQLGVRGDVRIGAHPIVGVNGGVLGYNYFPNFGDMILDTQDPAFYNANNTMFRNILSHEAGHGLGINHVEPINQTKLLEPFATTAFDGPQIDDIQALHRSYGDFHEKSNAGAGNNTAPNATHLGTVLPNSMVSIGADANENAANIEVFLNEADFISIDDDSDIDYLSFTITAPALVDLKLTPAGGPIYQEGADLSPGSDPTSPFDPTAQSNLGLTLFDTDGVTPLATATDNGIGNADSILGQTLAPGTYYAQVTGTANTVQLYQLDVCNNVPEPATAALVLLSLTALTPRRNKRAAIASV